MHDRDRGCFDFCGISDAERSSGPGAVCYVSCGSPAPDSSGQEPGGNEYGLHHDQMAADSYFATLDEKEEEDNGKTELDYCSGQVVFDHVSLRYPNSERDAVHDFNLTVNPGDSVALVGFSGSGKTSLVNMIPRFWNPTSGRILIDGYDTRDITLKSLRKQIAIVSQDVILFDDTIRNNIAYGVPDATEAQINKAIDDAA